MRTLLVALFIASTPSVSIRVNRSVLFEGEDIVVTCTVPRNANNRTIEAAVLPYSASSRQVNGEDAPITHSFTFLHMPSDVTEARCRLIDLYGASVTVTHPIEVVPR